MASTGTTRAAPQLPPIDARLVAPETRYEVHDGELVHVSPANAPHGIRHSKISALVEVHAAADFEVASDMLTRTSEANDFAPDVCVFPADGDPETGDRQLEHLAFEVVSTESLGHAGRKAAQLAGRGVRRVFAVDVERARALEWSAALGTWIVLDDAAYIEDLALAAPLPVAALVHAAKADDAVARALIFKRNPVIKAERTQERAEGKARGLAEDAVRGKREALLLVLAARGCLLGNADRARILDEQDPDRLDRWILRAATCTDIADVISEPEGDEP